MFDPTDEQQQVCDSFAFGDSLAVEALAGTGKTSTLVLIAERNPHRRGQYVAFNRAIVNDAAQRMPGNVAANTMHQLAHRAIGRRYSHRLRGSQRQQGAVVARHLGLDPLVITYGQQRKVLQPSYLASLVQRAVTVFCQTADPAPARRHVPYVEGIDVPTGEGRGWANNERVRDHIADALELAWRDVQDLDGKLRFTHAHYLKMWQLSGPTLPVEFVVCDEAQDMSPVMVDVVANQRHAQLVFVGDSQQQIYEFTGAINALAKVPTTNRAQLTRSFRFGPEIAGAANVVLAEIGTPLRVVGVGGAGTVGPLTHPRCILTRTNATAVDAVLAAQKAGRHVHLLGGGTEVVAFAEAASDLMAGRSTWHPELACFTTWGEVEAYVEQDPQGSELALLVKLVNDYGVATIVDALKRMCPEEAADVVVSTAHKAKGREWPSVQLADDFPDPRQSFDALMDPGATLPELRLIYVAVTRAAEQLDVSRCPLFQPVPPPVLLES